MSNVSSRAWRRLAALSLLIAASSFAQPALPGSDRAMLRQILQAMPKGGDLHNHLSGSVYAESYIRYAAADGICVDSVKLYITPCRRAADRPNPSASSAIVPASTLLAPYSSLYGTMLDALSMRAVPADAGIRPRSFLQHVRQVQRRFEDARSGDADRGSCGGWQRKRRLRRDDLRSGLRPRARPDEVR